MSHEHKEDIVQKIGLLKEIKPRPDWVLLTRQKIVGEHTQKARFSFDFLHVFRYYASKPAIVTPILVLFVFSGIALEQTKSSLPGDLLYPVKVSFEQTQQLNELQLAQRRMADLQEVVETKKTKNLSYSIKELEMHVDKASQSVAQLVENEPEKALQMGREVIQLQRDKVEIEKILGTTIGTEPLGEFEFVTRQLVENELADLESRSLTEEQEVLFSQARDAFEEKDYQKALELIWVLVNNQ